MFLSPFTHENLEVHLHRATSLNSNIILIVVRSSTFRNNQIILLTVGLVYKTNIILKWYWRHHTTGSPW